MPLLRSSDVSSSAAHRESSSSKASATRSRSRRSPLAAGETSWPNASRSSRSAERRPSAASSARSARHDETRLAGLCDAGEERDFGRALEQAGLGSNLTRGADGEARLLRLRCRSRGRADPRARSSGSRETFSRETETSRPSGPSRSNPSGRVGRPRSQLRRFFGSSAGKIKYARLLVEALDLARVPRPLDGVLTHV